MKWAIYCDGHIYGFFHSEAEAYTFAEKELPVAYAQGSVKVGRFHHV